MGSEKNNGCPCLHCTMESDAECVRKRPTPATAAETHGREAVVFVSVTVRVPLWDAGPLCAAIEDHCKANRVTIIPPSKDPPCSDASSTTSPASSSATSPACPPATPASAPGAASRSNANEPPAWATPQILAACKPGEVLHYDSSGLFVWSPSRGLWWDRAGQHGVIPRGCRLDKSESYTVPAQPARCDGSGKKVYTFQGSLGGCVREVCCTGCSACKPEPEDGAEDAARKILDGLMSKPGMYFGEDQYPMLLPEITAAIRADREKQAARQSPPPGEDQTADIVDRALKTLAMGPGAAAINAHGLEEATKQHLRFSFWSCCLDGLIRGGNNAARPATELRGKVRELAEWVGHVAVIGSRPRILAREVLAELEAP